MTNRILLPNFFFEEELQALTMPPSTHSKRLVAELGPVMGLLAAATPQLATATSSSRTIVLVQKDCRQEDLPPALQGVEFRTVSEVESMLADAPQLRRSKSEGWEVQAWGWSETAIALLRNTGFNVEAPDVSIVRQINRREFQAGFDRAISNDLSRQIDSFGRLCRTMPEVIAAIQTAYELSGAGWVIKADLSHAARNRLLGKKPVLTEADQAWLETRFDSDECVYIEPWVERIAEWGLQFQVNRSAHASPRIEFVGAAQMLTDKVGRYLGSFVKTTNPHDLPAIDHGFHVAESAAKLGYFGPLGIDCMSFRNRQDNSVWHRLSHDINGRLTMGRLALCLHGMVDPDETAIWIHCHANRPFLQSDNALALSNDAVRILPTSPGLIGGKSPGTRTLLVASKSTELLKTTCNRILNQSFS